MSVADWRAKRARDSRIWCGPVSPSASCSRRARSTAFDVRVEACLADAQKPDLSIESRFDLAYNAAHVPAHAALRRLGYRSENRYLVFQTLPHTLGIPSSMWRVLAKANEKRNLAEYEGLLQVDERLVADLIDAAKAVLAALPTAGSRA
jgi:hypothetical protein